MSHRLKLWSREEIHEKLSGFKGAFPGGDEAERRNLLGALLGVTLDDVSLDDSFETPSKFIGHLQDLTGQVSRVSGESGVELAGWEQAPFLRTLSWCLLSLYQALDSAVSERHWALESELRVSVNAYRVLVGYHPVDSGVKTVAGLDLERWTSELLEAIAAEAPVKGKFSLPFGTADHAIYVELTYLDSERLLCQVHNVSYDASLKGFHNYASSGRNQKVAYPFVAACLNLKQANHRAALGDYLSGLARLRLSGEQWQFLEEKRVSDSVVETVYGFAFPEDAKPDNSQQHFLGQLCQTVGNCVYRSYEVGMRLRLPTDLVSQASGGRSLIELLLSESLHWAVDARQGDAAPRSYGTCLQRSRRKSLEHFLAMVASEAKDEITAEAVRKVLPEGCWPNPLSHCLSKDSFIERKALWGQLTAQLAPHEVLGQEKMVPTVLTAVGGLGGVGKTELAKYYLNHAPHRYSLRLWFSADKREDLISTYRSFARQVIPSLFNTPLSDAEVIAGVRGWLSSHPGWLAIYDNADGTQVNDLLPFGGGHVLLTTRVGKEWEALYQHRDAHLTLIWVDVLEEDEAVEMLRVFSGLGDTFDAEAAKHLANRLGYLALAVRQAAECIRTRQDFDTYTVRDYLEAYESADNGERLTLLFQGLSADDAQNTSRRCVMTTWELSFQAIEEKAKQPGQQFLRHTRDLLQAMSYCGPEAVPVAVAKRWLLNRGCRKTEVVPVLRALDKQELLPIDKATQTFTLHRVVRDVLQLLHQYPEGDADKPLAFEQREAAYCQLADSLTDVYEDYFEQWDWESVDDILYPHLCQVEEDYCELRRGTIESKEMDEAAHLPVELVMLQVDRFYYEPKIRLSLSDAHSLNDLGVYDHCLSALENVSKREQKRMSTQENVSKHEQKRMNTHLRALMRWLRIFLRQEWEVQAGSDADSDDFVSLWRASDDETFAHRLRQAEEILSISPISLPPMLLMVSRVVMVQVHKQLGSLTASLEKPQAVFQTLNEKSSARSLNVSLLTWVLDEVIEGAVKCQDLPLLGKVLQMVENQVEKLNQPNNYHYPNPLIQLLSQVAGAAVECRDLPRLGEVLQIVEKQATEPNQLSVYDEKPLEKVLVHVFWAAVEDRDSALLDKVLQTVDNQVAGFNQTRYYGRNLLGRALSQMFQTAVEDRDSALLDKVLQVVENQAARINQPDEHGRNSLEQVLSQMFQTAVEDRDSALLDKVLQVIENQAARINQPDEHGRNSLEQVLVQVAEGAAKLQNLELLDKVLQVAQAQAVQLGDDFGAMTGAARQINNPVFLTEILAIQDQAAEVPRGYHHARSATFFSQSNEEKIDINELSADDGVADAIQLSKIVDEIAALEQQRVILLQANQQTPNGNIEKQIEDLDAQLVKLQAARESLSQSCVRPMG